MNPIRGSRAGRGEHRQHFLEDKWKAEVYEIWRTKFASRYPSPTRPTSGARRVRRLFPSSTGVLWKFSKRTCRSLGAFGQGLHPQGVGRSGAFPWRVFVVPQYRRRIDRRALRHQPRDGRPLLGETATGGGRHRRGHPSDRWASDRVPQRARAMDRKPVARQRDPERGNTRSEGDRRVRRSNPAQR